MHLIELLQRLKEGVEGHAGPHVGHERDLLIPSLCRQTQLCKLWDHLRRHIVNTVKSEILKVGRGLALARAGHAGNDNKLHISLLYQMRTSGSSCTPVTSSTDSSVSS